MKYYTIKMFSEESLLECITTKQKLKSMSDKTVKLFIENYTDTKMTIGIVKNIMNEIKLK